MDPLSLHDRAALLGIARGAVRHHLGPGAAPPLPAFGPHSAPRGAFVTLRVDGALRGCIGSFEPKGTLGGTVAAVAVSAASEDPRFPPLSPEEADELGYHVSALGPRTPMGDPSEIEIGRHGLLVKKGWHRGTLLPVVAVERGWDATAFLRLACLKAGLLPDAWKRGAEISVFEAIVLHE